MLILEIQRSGLRIATKGELCGIISHILLFDMYYSFWQDLPVRHVLDVMHCEKNICENILKTLWGRKIFIIYEQTCKPRTLD
jgi:hypothetical protein